MGNSRRGVPRRAVLLVEHTGRRAGKTHTPRALAPLAISGEGRENVKVWYFEMHFILAINS